MTTLGSRIKEVIAYYNTTMTQVAKELNISQSMVSKICGDKATPSDRTITDICRIYSINREWLTNGTGEMIDTATREADILESMNDTKSSSSDYFKQTMSFFLARMSAKDMEDLTSICNQQLEDLKNDPEKIAHAKALGEAFMEGFRTAQRIYEQYGSLPKLPNE